MKKHAVLSIAVIAASGAYALNEAAGRYDWFGDGSPTVMASGPLTPLAGAPAQIGAIPAPTPTPAPVAIEPAAAAPPAYARRERTAGATAREPGDYDEHDEREIRTRTDQAPLIPRVAQPIPKATTTLPDATPVAVVTPPMPTLAPLPPVSTPKAPGSQFRDGTFTGANADAYWGNVQVRAVVNGGKLVSVDVLAYPADRRTSQQINRYALPLLQREVVQAQSANVNIISGATLTTKAYLASLRSALQLAQ